MEIGRLRLETQRSWDVNVPHKLSKVLEAYERIKAESGLNVSIADLIVLGGGVGIEQAAKAAGHPVEVPFTPGRTDASQDQTDVEGFAVLDAAFSPDAVLASDVVDAGADGPARSSVYCVDLSGRLLWRHESPLLANCPAVGWDATTGEWMAVETNVEGLAEDTLVKWTMDGHMSSRVGLGQRMGTYRFLPSGRRLLSHRGELFETRRAGDIAAR